MSEPNENRGAAFTPVRFGLLLALLILATYPQVILGWETFVARDFGFFVYPLAHFQQDCFRQGQLPFWNPYNNCGVPFLAQWNTMPLYPPSLLYLLMPLSWGLGLFSLAHQWWAGLGMYFLARRWTGNNFAAAFAGTAFAFNGLTVNLLMWPSHIATFSWMPWLVLATEVAWAKGGRHIILAGIVGALQMLAGGPETILLTWLIVSALWLQQFIRSETPRRFLLTRFPLIVGLVFLLSAVQLFPFLDLVAHAQRATGYTDLRWSMPGSGLANFLVPMAFGDTATEGIFFQHGQYWTSSYYLGLATLWLALLAAISFCEGRIRLLVIISLLAVLCALGENTPFYPLLRKIIPQLSFITYPVKYVLVVTFAAPLLAAFALARLEKPKRLLPVGGALLALIGVIVVWAQHAPMPGDNSHATLLNGLSRAGFLVVTGTILLLLARPKASPLVRLASLALILIAWLDVYTHEPRQNPTTASSIYAQNIVRDRLAMNPQPELGGSRVMLSPNAALEFTHFGMSDAKNNFLAKRLGYCANVNLLDNVPKVDGFFSLSPSDFDNLLATVYGHTNLDFSPLMDFLGVSQTTAPDNALAWQSRTNFLPLVTAGQKPVFVAELDVIMAMSGTNFDASHEVLLPLDESSLVTITNQTAAKIISSKFSNTTVEAVAEASEPSLVVLAQTYYHDWQVTVDGQPVPLLRANCAFQAVEIPAGTHKIQWQYRDRAFALGAILTAFGLLASVIGWVVLRRRSVSC